MSASDKKKLRREENQAKAEAKKAASAKEAARLKLYTIIFAAALVLMVVVFVATTILNTGILEKNTDAVKVGEHTISGTMLNYFYIDQVYNWANQYSYYLNMFGLDVTKPLNEQTYLSATEGTWADYFLTSALSTAQTAYALYDDAVANGYTITSEDQTSVKATLSQYAMESLTGGYSNMNDYLVSIYGRGANAESFQEYLELVTMTASYYDKYYNDLSYDQTDFDKAQEQDYDAYTTYDYTYYFVSANDYREGGTKDETTGTITYTDEQIAAAVKKAKEAANGLLDDAEQGIDKLTEAVKAMDINVGKKEDQLSINENSVLKPKIHAAMTEWMTAKDRKPGDATVLEATTTNTTDGVASTSVTGYYVVIFDGKNDNEFELLNVRHILVSFKLDANASTPTEAQREAARKEAEDLLLQWKGGKADQDSFAALAKEHSDDGSSADGGLIADLYPGATVESFNDWCFDESRKFGDTGIVESEYGYHVMFFVGPNGTTYRNYIIENDLREADATEWYTALVEDTKVELITDKYVKKDLVLSAG